MPPVAFTGEVRIDGESYRARRLDGSQSYSVQYVPEVAGQQPTVQMDPLNEADWGDGRGWGQNVDNSEGMMLPGPQVTSVALPSAPGADLEQFSEQDGHIYAVGGRYAYKIASGSGPVTQDQDLGAAFLAVSIVPWKTNLIVGGRLTGNIWQLPSGGAWSNTMAGGAVTRGKLTTVWWNTDSIQSLRLVGEAAPTTLTYVSANPMLATDWKAAITLGAYPIRSMVANYTHAYAVTTGGLFDFGTDGNAPNLTPEVMDQVMDTNGKASLATDGYIYFNVGYTLKRVNVVGQDYARPEDCGWAAQVPQQCPMSGYCTALVKYGKWIWASVYDGTNTWVIKGRPSVSGVDRVGPMTWFVAPIYLPGVKVTAMHVSGLVSMNPRLWMAVTNASNVRSLMWAHLPLDSAYRDLRQARLYRFSSSFTYDAPDEDHGDDSMLKYLREFVGEGETLGTGPQIALSVAADGTAAFTPIGTYRANPRATVRPTSTVLAGRYILRHAGTGTSTTPPVLRKQSRRVIPRPDLLQVRAYQLVVGAEAHFGDGAIDGRSRRSAQRTLERLQRIGTVSFRDEGGTDLITLMVAGQTMTETEATLGDSEARRVLVVDCQVAVLSTVGTGFKWNDGTKWNTAGKVFS